MITDNKVSIISILFWVSVFNNLAFTVFIFYKIKFQGYFCGWEPITPILNFEIFMIFVFIFCTLVKFIQFCDGKK